MDDLRQLAAGRSSRLCRPQWEPPGRIERHSEPGSPYDADIPQLETASRERMRGEPVRLDGPQAKIVVKQFHETAGARGWELLAVAVMANHVHLLVGTDGDPDPAALLRDFKSYASRALNSVVGSRRTWWTESGSRRVLRNDLGLLAAARYVRDQVHALAVWIADWVTERLKARFPEREPGHE